MVHELDVIGIVTGAKIAMLDIVVHVGRCPRVTSQH